MQRRAFLLALVGREGDSPRNQLAEAGNQFIAQLNLWVKAFNAAKPGSVDLAVAEAFEPLPGLWERVEKRWRNWLCRNCRPPPS